MCFMRILISLFLSLILANGLAVKAIEVKEKLYDLELNCSDHDTTDDHDITIDYYKPTRCALQFSGIDERLIGSRFKVFESVLINESKPILRTKIKKRQKIVPKNRRVKFNLIIPPIKTVQKKDEYYMDSSFYATLDTVDFETLFKSKKLVSEFDSKFVNNQGFGITTGMDLAEIWEDLYGQ